MEYLVAIFAQSLPMSVIGLVGAFFFRKSTQSAIFAGVIGSVSLPMISLVMGLTSRPDLLLASALYGILFGWGVARVSK
jgi:hypothetical protein